MDIVPGTTYKLKVKGPDGELTVSTTVPTVVTPTIYTNTKTYPYIERKNGSVIFTHCDLNLRVVFHPVDPESAFRVFYPIDDFHCNRSVINKQGKKLQKRVVDICLLKPDGRITLEVYHYSTDTFKAIRPTDSLKVPGGAGFFGSFYKKRLHLTIQEAKRTLFIIFYLHVLL